MFLRLIYLKNLTFPSVKTTVDTLKTSLPKMGQINT